MCSKDYTPYSIDRVRTLPGGIAATIMRPNGSTYKTPGFGRWNNLRAENGERRKKSTYQIAFSTYQIAFFSTYRIAFSTYRTGRVVEHRGAQNHDHVGHIFPLGERGEDHGPMSLRIHHPPRPLTPPSVTPRGSGAAAAST